MLNHLTNKFLNLNLQKSTIQQKSKNINLELSNEYFSSKRITDAYYADSNSVKLNLNKQNENILSSSRRKRRKTILTSIL